MKANELMIGDWVNYIGAYHDENSGELIPLWKTPIPIKVTFITPDAVQYEDEYGCYECANYELHPIPITTEILEKNGFEKGTYELPVSGKKIPKYSYAEVEGDIKEVALLPLTMNCTWSFGAVDGTHIPVLQFVHQLQHAIRLCGIEKEIEL